MPELPALQAVIERQYAREKAVYDMLVRETQETADEMASVRPTDMLSKLEMP